MNKSDLIDELASAHDMTRSEVSALVDAALSSIRAAVARGERVALAGFGVFEAQARSARSARNPRTGETIKLRATKVPKFRASREFKDSVASKPPAKKAPVKKTVAKKAPVKKTVAKKAPVKKTVAKKAPVKKTVAKKAPVKKTVAKKAVRG